MAAFDELSTIEFISWCGEQIKHLEKEMAKSASMHLDVGVIDYEKGSPFTDGIDATVQKVVAKKDPDGNVYEEEDPNVKLGDVAHMHEYGFINAQGNIIPERSFIRSTAAQEKEFITNTFWRTIDKQMHARGDMRDINIRKAYKHIGEILQDQVRNTFKTSYGGRWEPLADPTRDGRTTNGKPLRDTYELMASIAARIGTSQYDTEATVTIEM